MKRALLDMTLDELRSAVAEIGQPAYRAEQLADWVYGRGAIDPAAMTNVPKALREAFDVLTSRVAVRTESEDGTIKLLLEMHDGEHVETVLIPSGKRATACVSTQAGCAMGCSFCASGLDGLKRNLRSGEILEQLLHLQQASQQRVTNVVFMGMGEPLANYNATVTAVRALTDPGRFGISARRITVSTIGIPKAIRRLAQEDLAITLAISLHAPNDALRRQLMPSVPSQIDEIIEAAKEFFEARKREITLEYVLLGGVNDTNVCAEALADLAHTLRCNVNVIRYNPVASLPYERPTQVATKAFVARLQKRGVNVQLRHSRGLDAGAACGQLRAEEQGPRD
jgi:23S rRNA (adenine2503-C2)-methyltransferase